MGNPDTQHEKQEKQGKENLLVKMPLSKIVATLEPLAARGVLPEDLNQLSSGFCYQERLKMICELLTLKRNLFLTPLDGNTELKDLEARWQVVERKLFEATNVSGDILGAFGRLVDLAGHNWEYELFVLQVLAETVYQLAFAGSMLTLSQGEPYLESVEKLRALIAGPWVASGFWIGFASLDALLPEDLRDLPPVGYTWGPTQMEPNEDWTSVRFRTMKQIIDRYYPWFG